MSLTSANSSRAKADQLQDQENDAHGDAWDDDSEEGGRGDGGERGVLLGCSFCGSHGGLCGLNCSPGSGFTGLPDLFCRALDRGEGSPCCLGEPTEKHLVCVDGVRVALLVFVSAVAMVCVPGIAVSRDKGEKVGRRFLSSRD